MFQACILLSLSADSVTYERKITFSEEYLISVQILHPTIDFNKS